MHCLGNIKNTRGRIESYRCVIVIRVAAHFGVFSERLQVNQKFRHQSSLTNQSSN